jgi:CPA1 family monovalent cation:H+ antiporter
MTFAPVMRLLRLDAGTSGEAQLRNQARESAVLAAVARLPEIAAAEKLDPAASERLSVVLRAQATRYRARANLLDADGGQDGATVVAGYESATRAGRTIIAVQREELLRWRDAGRLPDVTLRALETELDHEENTLMRRGGS